MPKSSKSGRTNKPKKPHPDFPLHARADGRWAKKIRGRLHYFGRWGTKSGDTIVPVNALSQPAQEAIDLYNEQRDDLHSGRTGNRTASACSRPTNCINSSIPQNRR